MTAAAGGGLSSTEAQLGVALAAVFFGFLLTGLGWALRRIIIRELDHLGDQLQKLNDDFRSWRDSSDRRATALESRFNLLELTTPRSLRRRADDPPYEEFYDYEAPGGRHEHTA